MVAMVVGVKHILHHVRGCFHNAQGWTREDGGLVWCCGYKVSLTSQFLRGSTREYRGGPFHKRRKSLTIATVVRAYHTLNQVLGGGLKWFRTRTSAYCVWRWPRSTFSFQLYPDLYRPLSLCILCTATLDRKHGLFVMRVCVEQ
jgi:hypothetical protein